MSEDDGLKAMGQVIQIDEARIRDHLGEMVRGTVEETLNALLDAEADRLCGAGRYERSRGRQDVPAVSVRHSAALRIFWESALELETSFSQEHGRQMTDPDVLDCGNR